MEMTIKRMGAKAAKEQKIIEKYLQNKTIIKIIFVKNKLMNVLINV